MGKRNTKGPDMIIPQCTRQSLLIVLESLTSLQANTLTEIGHIVTFWTGSVSKGHGMHAISKECEQTTTCLQRLTTLTEESTAWKTWKMICCAFIRKISHISLGPDSFYPERIIKGESPNRRPKRQSAISKGTGSKEDTRRETEEKETGEYGRANERANWHPSLRPYCMCPTAITASLEESEEVTTACQVVDVNVAMRSTTSTAVRVQTIY